MKALAPAILYALFVWWISTGLVLMVVLRRRARDAALVGAALLVPVCLWVLAGTAAQSSVTGAYAAFSAAVILWGTQEVAFLTGAITGPRPRPCPPQARGFDRFCFAVCAILYHEVALVACGAAVLMVTRGEPNQTGALTFLALWIMRLGAKFNLFLGVPVLNDEMLPSHLDFIRSYFRRGPTNSLMPIVLIGSVLFAWMLGAAALSPAATPAEAAGDALVATLLGLAAVEHVFMLVPLPILRIWQWSTRTPAPRPHEAATVPPRPLPTRP